MRNWASTNYCIGCNITDCEYHHLPYGHSGLVKDNHEDRLEW